jgi:hypothetical protein
LRVGIGWRKPDRAFKMDNRLVEPTEVFQLQKMTSSD